MPLIVWLLCVSSGIAMWLLSYWSLMGESPTMWCICSLALGVASGILLVNLPEPWRSEVKNLWKRITRYTLFWRILAIVMCTIILWAAGGIMLGIAGGLTEYPWWQSALLMGIVSVVVITSTFFILVSVICAVVDRIDKQHEEA